MRHKRSRNRLKQKPAHARMLQRNLLTSVLLYESVRTTKKRALVIQPEIDKLIQYAKTHEPQVAIRHLNKFVTDKNASRKVMEVFIKRFAKRNSGLTRMKALGARDGDGAELVQLSFVEGVEVPAAPKAEALKNTEDAPEKAPAKKPAAKKTTTAKK